MGSPAAWCSAGSPAATPPRIPPEARWLSAEATLHPTSLAVGTSRPPLRRASGIPSSSAQSRRTAAHSAVPRRGAGTRRARCLRSGWLGARPGRKRAGSTGRDRADRAATARAGHALARLDLKELEEPHEALLAVQRIGRGQGRASADRDGRRRRRAGRRRPYPARPLSCATTDAAGVARVKLANGDYELVVWKAGYDTAPSGSPSPPMPPFRSTPARCRRTIPTRFGRPKWNAIAAGNRNHPGPHRDRPAARHPARPPLERSA